MLKKQLSRTFIFLVILLVFILSTFLAKARQETGFDIVDAYIETEMEEWNLPGMALAIVQDGEIVYMKGYGIAGPKDRPMTAQTPFIIASLSKSFTALAIMQLVENGQIDLDEPVQTYLPWFHLADEEASAQITVRHLLNQNSGIASTSGMKAFFSEDLSSDAINNSARNLANDQLLYPVGETYEYSNSNYHVLGAIVEAVSGQAYADYIQEHIFTLLDMTNCYTSRDEAQQNGLSTGYGRWWFKIPVRVTSPYNPGNVSAGGLICDAEGVAHYLIAYLNEGQYEGTRILSPQGIAQMHTPAVRAEEEQDSYYGMGWIIGPVNGIDAVYHSGDAPTYQTAVLMVPKEELGIVLITNTNNITILYSTRAMAADIMNILHGKQTTGFEQDSFILMIYLTVLGPFALALLWAGWSIPRVYRRRKQRQTSLRGVVQVLWKLVAPLLLDSFFIVYYLIMTPNLWGFPLKAYPIMYPNVWTVMLVGAFLGGLGIIVRLVVYLQIGKRTD